jgi:hypothetical protein
MLPSELVLSVECVLAGEVPSGPSYLSLSIDADVTGEGEAGLVGVSTTNTPLCM